MFHRNEIDEGDGRSISDEFIIFVNGISLIFCVFIRKMMRVSDLGCGLVLLLQLVLLLGFLLRLLLWCRMRMILLKFVFFFVGLWGGLL
jgi:hypothetical protein